MFLSNFFPDLFEKRNYVKAKIVLFVDAGESGSRGALVVEKGTQTEVVAAIYNDTRLRKEEGSYIQSTKRAISHVLGQITEIVKAHAKRGVIYDINSISIILGAPFYLSHTQRIISNFEKPIVITNKTLNFLLTEGRKKASPFENSLIVSERVSDVLINGYHTDDFYGKEASSISFSLFTTAINEKFYTLMEGAVHHYFKAPLIIDTSALAFSSALCSALPTVKDFLLVFVGTETSEIVLIKNRLLYESVSIPSGYQTTLLSLSKRLKETPQGTRSRISLHLDGKLSEKDSVSLNAALLEERGKWFSLFQDAIIPLSEESLLPEKILLVTEKDMRPLFLEFLSSKSFITEVLPTGAFSVIPLDENQLSHYPHFRDGAVGDPLLGLSILFAEMNRKPIEIHKDSYKLPVLQSKL